MNDLQRRQELSSRFDKLDSLSATIVGQWLIRNSSDLDELEVAVSLGEKLAEVAKKDEERRVSELLNENHDKLSGAMTADDLNECRLDQEDDEEKRRMHESNQIALSHLDRHHEWRAGGCDEPIRG